MGLFSRKPAYCTICKIEITHKHKPKREWNVKGPLCANCHVDKTKEFYEATIRQPCVICGTTKIISDLWEPRWQWDMDGLLCKDCFDKKRRRPRQKEKLLCVMWCKAGIIPIKSKTKMESRWPALPKMLGC